MYNMSSAVSRVVWWHLNGSLSATSYESYVWRAVDSTCTVIDANQEARNIVDVLGVNKEECGIALE